MDDPTGVQQTVTPGGQCLHEDVIMTLVYEDDVCESYLERSGKEKVLTKAEQLKKIEKS